MTTKITTKTKLRIIFDILLLVIINIIFSIFLTLVFLIMFIPMIFSERMFVNYSYFFTKRLNILRKDKPDSDS